MPTRRTTRFRGDLGETPGRPGVIVRAPGTLRAEIAVIGSGPGGAITACILAEAGRDVLLIEEGPNLPPGAGPTFSVDEMTAKYRNGGVTAAFGPSRVAYVEGCCVGGGSEINSGLYHRTPAHVLERWRRDYGVVALTDADLSPHFEACERDLGVSYLPCPAAPASRKLAEGAARLGWAASEAPRWHRYDRPHAATPAPHIATLGRQTMSRTYIPWALRAGCRLLAATRIRALKRLGARWVLQGVADGGDRVSVDAKVVFICGGAVQSPAVLRRSGLTHNIGDSLRMHPTIKLVARFPEPVNIPGSGVPVHQVREFSPRYSFGGSVSTPGHLALGLVHHPEPLAQVDTLWPFLAAYYAMIVGTGSGTLRVVPGCRDPIVTYQVTPQDRFELASALRDLCRLLFQAGAVEIHPTPAGLAPLRALADVERLPKVLPAGVDLMTVHLSSSCPFGEFTPRTAVDSFGKIHGADGLYINDASILCTQTVVNPQGTIMALARRNALKFLGKI